MNDNALQSGLWLMRALFCAIIALTLFFQLLPINTAPVNFTGPDLVMAFAFAWAVRRPDYLPVAMIAVVFLMCDLLLQRPPGLWAAFMVLACESLKTQVRTLRDAGFFTELVSVSFMIVGVSVAYHIVLLVMLIDIPSFTLAAMQTGFTILFYPLAVAFSQVVLSVRRISPGDLDRLGGSA